MQTTEISSTQRRRLLLSSSATPASRERTVPLNLRTSKAKEREHKSVLAGQGRRNTKSLCGGNMPTDDETLIQSIVRGDSEAFESLYRCYFRLLHSTATRILHDWHEAEDVMQEVSIAIWRKGSLFDSMLGRPFSWILSITRNKAIEHLRIRNRRRQILRTHHELNPSIESIVAQYTSKPPYLDIGPQLAHAVQGLPTKQRVPIELAFFQNLTHNQIAQILNEPLGTIKARIRRGIDKLRLQISQDS